mgnify:FL=1
MQYREGSLCNGEKAQDPKAISLLTSSLGLKRVNRMRFLLRRSMAWQSKLEFSTNYLFIPSILGVISIFQEDLMPRKKGRGGRARPHPEVLRLSYLPPETLLYIFSFLEPRELVSCMLVAMEWFIYASDDSLWLAIYKHYFPHGTLPSLRESFVIFFLRTTRKDGLHQRVQAPLSVSASSGT